MAADENGAAVSQPSDLRRPFCRLQGRLAANLAAAGPLQCRCARPPFNGAAAVDCFLPSSSLLFSSCMVSNKNRNNTEIAI